MKVSTRGRYGLRAMLDLALNSNSGAIPLREISERQDISEQYLEQLFASLRKAGIVKSVRGAHGGYLLNQTPEKTTVKDIITALEGPIAPSECVLDEGSCNNDGDCVIHNLWVEIKENIDNQLESISLEDLKKRYYHNKSGYVYHI